MDSHLFMNARQVLLADVRNFNDLARVNLLSRIDRRPDSLLFRPIFIDILQKVGR